MNDGQLPIFTSENTGLALLFRQNSRSEYLNIAKVVPKLYKMNENDGIGLKEFATVAVF